jgi:NAD(P)H-hydrate epimerase
MDAGTGKAYEPSIRAAATLTLALPKVGLRAGGIRDRVGELYLADISVPPGVYANLGIEVGALFAKDDIVRLW